MTSAATHMDVSSTLGGTSEARAVPLAPELPVRSKAARAVLKQIVLRKVPVAMELPDGRRWGSSDPAAPLLLVHDEMAFFARLAHSPMIGIGESYMAGEWSTAPGTDLAKALTPFASTLSDIMPAAFYKLRHVVMPKLIREEENTKDGSRRNIHRHYDLSNEMFEQFLDPSLTYSCGLFDRLDPAPVQADHEAAQIAKIDAVLDAAGVTSGSRVLEIGTGWGSLAIRAAERGARVVSLTISSQQAELARERIAAAGYADQVEVVLRDYRDEQGRYDAVVSVEMIEAVGEKYWPTYFSTIDRLLLPGGRVAIQAIIMEHHRMVATRNTYSWIHKYIFPGGLLPSIKAVEHVLDRHTTLRLSQTQHIGPHYAHTLRLWREQFLHNWSEVQGLGFDETFRRMWEYYLAYCEAGFASGYLDDAILTLER